MTPQALAAERQKKGHPGMAEYIAFFNSMSA